MFGVPDLLPGPPTMPSKGRQACPGPLFFLDSWRPQGECMKAFLGDTMCLTVLSCAVCTDSVSCWL